MQTAAAMTSNPDRDDFGTLLRRHSGIVFKVANSYARHPEDRADLAQDIAAQLWRAWPKYEPTRSVTTWMYRIALNVAISHVRERSLRRRHDAVPLDQGMHEVADGNVLLRRLMGSSPAIEKLREQILDVACQ